MEIQININPKRSCKFGEMLKICAHVSVKIIKFINAFFSHINFAMKLHLYIVVISKHQQQIAF